MLAVCDGRAGWHGPGLAGGLGRARVLAAVAAAGPGHVVVPGYLPAECAPVLFADWVSAPRNASTRGKVSGFGDQVKVAAVVDGQLASRDQAVQDPRV